MKDQIKAMVEAYEDIQAMKRKVDEAERKYGEACQAFLQSIDYEQRSWCDSHDFYSDGCLIRVDCEPVWTTSYQAASYVTLSFPEEIKG